MIRQSKTGNSLAPPGGMTAAAVLGLAGLGGQVCWFRIASAAVGGTTASAAITLSAAMAGLAAGAFVGGSLARRWMSRAVLIGIVICSAMALMGVPQFLQQIAQIEGSLGVRRLFTGALLFLGYLPFGAVVPAIIVSSIGGSGQAAEQAGRVYSANAFGSVIGAVLIGNVLAPRMALDTISALLGAAVFLALIRLPRIGSPDSPVAASKESTVPKALLAVVFGLGFLGLAAELLWFRTFGFFWKGGTQAYSLVVAAYVAGLSVGSGIAGKIVGRWRIGHLGMVSCCYLVGITLLVAASQSLRAVTALTGFERALVAAALVGVPACMSASAFIFVIDAVRSRQGLAVLYALNNAGSALGPLVLWGAMSWLPWPTWSLAILAILYATIALTASIGKPRSILAFVVAACIGAPLVWAVLGQNPFESVYGAGSKQTARPDFRATSIVFSRSDDSVVTVTRDTQTGYEMLWVDRNGQADSSLWSMRVKRDLGRLPVEVRSTPPRKALFIGLGTGVTAAAALDSKIEDLEIAELSPGVIDAAQTVLSDFNGALFTRPNFRVRYADGRSVLADTVEPYDLIVTDITYPSVPGAGNIFSREFYALVKKRLAADGMFVHWVPCFQLSPADLSAVIAAFLETFPQGSAWVHFIQPTRIILGLVGGNVPKPLPQSHVPYLALGPEGLRALAGDAQPIRDADPRLEYRSPPPSESFFEMEILEQVLRVLRASAPPEEFIAPEDRTRWKQAQKAWILFGDAASAEFQSRRAENSATAYEQLQEDLYKEAQRLAPGVVPVEYFLNMRHFQSLMTKVTAAQDPAALESSLREAASDLSTGSANMELAALLDRQGRRDEAIIQIRQAIQKHPRSADSYIALASLLFRNGNYEESRQAFAQACKLRPDRPQLYRDLERELLRAGR